MHNNDFYETSSLALAILMGILMVLGGILECYLYWAEAVTCIPVLFFYLCLKQGKKMLRHGRAFRKIRTMSCLATVLFFAVLSLQNTVGERKVKSIFWAVLFLQMYRLVLAVWMTCCTVKNREKTKQLATKLLWENNLLSAIVWCLFICLIIW